MIKNDDESIYSNPCADLTMASKLTITREAFDQAPPEKQAILKMLKAQSLTQTFEYTRSVVVWYFLPEVFIEITKKFPWLLDSSLGEKNV